MTVVASKGIIFDKPTIFQRYKRQKLSQFDPPSPKLNETGDYHIYKREVVRLIKYDDTGLDRKKQK